MVKNLIKLGANVIARILMEPLRYIMLAKMVILIL
jgi:hypothetical protein